jgi:hydrogenase maturation protease HycI
MAPSPEKILLGIGSAIREDDGAGSLLASEFSCPGWLTVDGGTVPENYFSVIKKARPGLLVIADACVMGLPPGSIRIIRAEDISAGEGFNTHSRGLGWYIQVLSEHAGKIIFIGIEPQNTGIGEGLSPPVHEAVEKLKKIIAAEDFSSIPVIQNKGF